MKRKLTLQGCRYCASCITAAIVAVGQGIGINAASLPGKTFTSSNRNITAMVSDSRYLWGSSQGLLRINKVSGETSLFTPSNSGLGGKTIHALAIDKDSALMVATAGAGIVRFTGSKWERLSGLSDSNVWNITVGNQGALWAWTQNQGILRRNDGAWQPVVNNFSGLLTTDFAGNVWILNYPSSAPTGCNDAWIHEYVNGGLQSSLSLASVCAENAYPHHLVVDTKKNCWIHSYDVLIKINANSITHYPVNQDASQNISITALAVDSNGKLLIAVRDFSAKTCGLFLYDQINGKGQPFDSCAFTFDAPYITAACADPAINGFWCATSDGRIIKIDMFNRPAIFKTYNSVLPSNSIAALLIDTSDNVWAATDNGIARCADTAWTLYPAAGDTFPGNDACCLARDSSGIIWAGFRQPLISSMSSTGLSYFSGQQWRMLFRTHYSQKAIAVDTAGDQWVVAEDGVYRYHDMKAEKVMAPGAGGFDTTVNAIAFDNNSTPWIGTHTGLKKYENGVWNGDTTINRFIPNNKTEVPVNVIRFSSGTAWIGTALGLFKCAGGNCERIDTAGAMLPDPYVQCIAVDGPNSAWIGTKRGLVRLAGENHTTYTCDNSPLFDNDITACAVARNGDVWIGTRLGGLTVLEHTAVAAKRGPVSNKNFDTEPIAVSVTALRLHTCRISIHSRATATIGFSILSLQGKRIKQFGALSVGSHPVTFTWDRTDCSNRPVADGVYLGIVTVNGRNIGSKILLR
jgi:ligand-binding sensor domain-containing protein